MMTAKLQITILLALLIALGAIVNMIRRKSLELKYALSWLFVLAAVAVFAAFPRTMVVISRFLGIDAPVNMIFFLGFCFSLVIIYTLTVSLSRMSTKMRKLTQIIALNEDRIKLLEAHLAQTEQRREANEDGKHEKADEEADREEADREEADREEADKTDAES